MIKKLLLFLFISLIFPICVFAHEVASATTIHIDEKGFSSTDITIKQGEKIIFENTGKKDHWPASNIHPTHSIYSEFDPKKGIKPGESWSFVFDKAGSWRFHDHLFPEFTGTITVTASEKADPSFFEKIVNFFKGLFGVKSKVADAPSHEYNSSILQNDQSMSSDENALYSYVKKFGTQKAVAHLASVDLALGNDCHQSAHKLGKFAYEIYGEKTFGECSGECHSGCYHGATEAYFQKHGTANLQTDLQVICGGAKNNFFTHQCLHGVGHGLMAWTDYDIHEALKDCDMLKSGQDSCYSGVFMENIIGGLAVDEKKETDQNTEKHFTKYLSADPQFPCTVVGEKYKAGCYFYQSTRMAELAYYDFVKVTAACLDAPTQYQSLCIESMGRDISGATSRNPEKSIAACQNVPSGDLRSVCLRGAVQDTFWEKGGQDTAIHFCKLLKDENEKLICYGTINERATQILTEKKEKEQFCQKEESSYVMECQSVVR